jgi:hypothetical protein
VLLEIAEPVKTPEVALPKTDFIYANPFIDHFTSMSKRKATNYLITWLSRCLRGIGIVVLGQYSGHHPNKGIFSFGTGKTLYVLEDVEEIRAVSGFLVWASV